MLQVKVSLFWNTEFPLQNVPPMVESVPQSALVLQTIVGAITLVEQVAMAVWLPEVTFKVAVLVPALPKLLAQFWLDPEHAPDHEYV